MDTIKIKIFAKVNLALDVKGSYPDGYHRLDMLMASVDMYDTLCLTVRWIFSRIFLSTRG